MGIREVVVVGAGKGYRVGGGESGEACRVVQLAFGAHVHLRAGSFEAGIDVGLVRLAKTSIVTASFTAWRLSLVPVCEALKERT